MPGAGASLASDRPQALTLAARRLVTFGEGGSAGAWAAFDERAMRRALRQARRALGRTAPNPPVGCVIVQGTRVVGEGRTQPGGRPHAETVALEAAGPAARGATVYVTLEPCAHHGRTPPCTDALVAAGIARLVVACGFDPDPRVAGQGLHALRAAGLTVETGLLEADARALMSGFFSRVTRGRPVVTVLASGPGCRPCADRRDRSTHDALMSMVHNGHAGSTALLVRFREPLGVTGAGCHPARPERDGIRALVIVPSGSAPAPSPMPAAIGFPVLACPTRPEGGLDLRATMVQLGALGLTSVLVEDGSLARALEGEDLIDRWLAAPP